MKKPRRKRSEVKRRDLLKGLQAFASRVERFVETSDARHFTSPDVDDGIARPGHITVAMFVRGSFGVGEKLFDAIRILGGHMIAADDKRPQPRPSDELTCEWIEIESDSGIYNTCKEGEEWHVPEGLELYPHCMWCGGRIVVGQHDKS